MKNPSTAFSRASRSCSDRGGTSGRREAGCGMRGARLFTKQGPLARVPLLLARQRFGERRVERRHQLGAVAAQAVARARVDERLDHALVAEPQVDALAQLHERAVWSVRLAARP